MPLECSIPGTHNLRFVVVLERNAGSERGYHCEIESNEGYYYSSNLSKDTRAALMCPQKRRKLIIELLEKM
jgi:hypothetical protein